MKRFFFSGCNLVFRDKKFSDDFASNSFPSNYSNNMFCNYTTHVSSAEEDKKYTTYLFITSLDLEWSPSCEADSLSVFDGPNPNANILKKFCGSTRRRSVIASGKEMFVQFRSNYRVTAKDSEHTFCEHLLVGFCLVLLYTKIPFGNDRVNVLLYYFCLIFGFLIATQYDFNC